MLENRNKGKLLSIHSSLSRLYFAIDRPCQLFVLAVQTADRCASGENDEDETRKARDTLMTRLWPRIEHCALESVTKRTNATLLVLSACLKLGVRVWTRRKMGGKVGLICGSCWSGKYSMYIIIIILSRYTKMLFNNWEFTRRAISFLGINKNKTNLHAKNSKNKRRVFFF